MKTLSKVIFLGVLLFPGLLMAGEVKTLKMKIEGMTCGMCAAKVKKQLLTVCKEITIDREKGVGTCRYQLPTTADQVVNEAKKTGFGITKLK